MVDTRISELPAATTPLDGTELVEAVQGGVSVQVPTSELGLGGSLDSLTDVDTSTTPPDDAQALVWDAASGLWVPGDVAAGGGGGVGGTEATPYTPILGNGSLGNGTLVGEYVDVGNLRFVRARLTWGSTTSLTASSTTTISLPAGTYATPVTSSTGAVLAGDSSTGQWRSGSCTISNSVFASFTIDGVNYTLNWGTPWTWAAGDSLYVSGVVVLEGGSAGGGGGGGLDPVRASAALANLTTTATSTYQIWGSVLTIPQADCPSSAAVIAAFDGKARKANDSAVGRGAEARIEISLDGGATWVEGLSPRPHFDALGGDQYHQIPLTGTAFHSGPVTGDVQVRVQGRTFDVAGQPIFEEGLVQVMVMDVGGGGGGGENLSDHRFSAKRITTNFALTSGVYTAIVYNSEVEDPDSGFNTTTGEFTIPAGQGGTWEFGHSTTLSGIDSAAAQFHSGFVAVNGTLVAPRMGALNVPASGLGSGAFGWVGGVGQIVVAAGDVISMRVNATGSAPVARTDSAFWGRRVA